MNALDKIYMVANRDSHGENLRRKADKSMKYADRKVYFDYCRQKHGRQIKSNSRVESDH